MKSNKTKTKKKPKTQYDLKVTKLDNSTTIVWSKYSLSLFLSNFYTQAAYSRRCHNIFDSFKKCVTTN